MTPKPHTSVMLRQIFRWNWPITLYMQVVILYSMIYSCFAQQYRFTTQPMYSAVTEGQTVSLYCEWRPDLHPGHTLEWYYFKGTESGKKVKENTKYILLNKPNSSSLSIQSFSLSDVGSYRCEIQGSSTTSDAAQVSMLTCNPKTDEGELGDFPECRSTSHVVLIEWFKNEESIGEKSATSTRPGKALSMEDDGVELTCRATYQDLLIGNCTTTPLILKIEAWIEKNPPGSIQEGTQFNLTCLVNGNADKYEYHWMFRKKPLIETDTAIGEKNVLAFSDAKSTYDGKKATCNVTRANRKSVVASFTIRVIDFQTVTTDLPTTSLSTNRIPQSPTTGSKRSQGPLASIIVIGVAIVIVVIIATILIICFLSMRHKKRCKNVTKHETVPMKESSYEAIKERPTSTESRQVSDKNAEKYPIREQLITDSTVCHESRALDSRPNEDLNTSEVLYAEPAMPVDSDRQLGSSQVVSYDTPRKTVSLDNLDDPSKHGTSLSVESMSELYATPSKTLSRESIDAMYAKPNKTPSRESIDELYSKPNKSATNTPKSSHKDPTQMNVEGLTYADVDFQNGTFPPPENKDYSLEYASVQFIS